MSAASPKGPVATADALVRGLNGDQAKGVLLMLAHAHPEEVQSAIRQARESGTGPFASPVLIKSIIGEAGR